MFLIALSSVALAVLLALGPLFLALLLFESSRRFFEAWVAQLANYALITILTVLAAALLLQIVQAYAEQTAARGNALVTVDALDMVLVAVLVFLLHAPGDADRRGPRGGHCTEHLRRGKPPGQLGDARREQVSAAGPSRSAAGALQSAPAAAVSSFTVTRSSWRVS